VCVSSPWEGSVSRLRGLRVTHCPPRRINRSRSPRHPEQRGRDPARPQPSCRHHTMALVLLAPLAVGLLALSCSAAPLQSKPQAVVTFPGELVSPRSDLELAEVRGAQPHHPLPHPGPPGLPGRQRGAAGRARGLPAVLRPARCLGWDRAPGVCGARDCPSPTPASLSPSCRRSPPELPAAVRLHHGGGGEVGQQARVPGQGAAQDAAAAGAGGDGGAGRWHAGGHASPPLRRPRRGNLPHLRGGPQVGPHGPDVPVSLCPGRCSPVCTGGRSPGDGDGRKGAGRVAASARQPCLGAAGTAGSRCSQGQAATAAASAAPQRPGEHLSPGRRVVAGCSARPCQRCCPLPGRGHVLAECPEQGLTRQH